eukprot:UC1_evm2s422
MSAAASPARGKHWQSDGDAKTCFLCQREFTLLFRRHHCRLCGRIVCDPCSQARASVCIGQLQLEEDRVCGDCDEYLNVTRPILAHPTHFTMYTGGGMSTPVTVHVEEDDCILFHEAGGARTSLGNYPLAWLRHVVDGAITENFMYQPEVQPPGACACLCGGPEPGEAYCVADEPHCFSIIFTGNRTLDLEAKSKSLKEAWLSSLAVLLERRKTTGFALGIKGGGSGSAAAVGGGTMGGSAGESGVGGSPRTPRRNHNSSARRKLLERQQRDYGAVSTQPEA